MQLDKGICTQLHRNITPHLARPWRSPLSRRSKAAPCKHRKYAVRASASEQQDIEESGSEQGTLLRIQRQTFLPASRDATWRVLKDVCKDEEWQDISAVFACLESIYRAEFQQLGEEVLEAFGDANSALVAPPAPAKELEKKLRQQRDKLVTSSRRSGGDKASGSGAGSDAEGGSTGRASGSAADASQGSGGQLSTSESMGSGQDLHATKHSSATRAAHSANGASSNSASPSSHGPDNGVAARQRETVAAGRSSSVATEDAQGDGSSSQAAAHSGRGQGRQQLQAEALQAAAGAAAEGKGLTNADPERQHELAGAPQADAGAVAETVPGAVAGSQTQEKLPDGVSEAEAADRAFMRQLMLLLKRSHFDVLSARDVAMSRSLNSEYLSQLFVKTSSSRLDYRLVEGQLADRGLPPDAAGLLMARRGYGELTASGQLLGPKFDFLQLLAVQSLISVARSGARLVLGKAQERVQAVDVPRYWESGSDEDSSSSLDSSLETDGSLSTFGEEAAQELGKKAKEASEVTLSGMSEWGLAPRRDAVPLEQFNDVWRVREPRRMSPAYLRRVSMRQAVGGAMGVLKAGPRYFLGKAETVEPTFKEVLVLYRQGERKPLLKTLQELVLGPRAPELRQRNPICMRVYRDVPIASWQVVHPAKVIQFKPLDALRADAIAVAGLIALLAQAKYDNIVLQVVTFASGTVLAFKIASGFKRVFDSSAKVVNSLLAEKTVASQEGAIELLSNSAALQQFKQAALSYLILHASPVPLRRHELARQVEALAEEALGEQVAFSAREALAQLQRFKLLEEQASGEGRLYSVVHPDTAFKALTAHWNALLLERVDTILQGVD